MSCVRKIRDVSPVCAIAEITDKEAFEKSVVYSGTFKSQTIKSEITIGDDEVWTGIQALNRKHEKEDTNGKS